jgi:7-carboxy-7-deazaguanine synthase
MMYKINEIYTCLQGEGKNLGTPSLLVRFQICNLRCSWCDTPYTHTLKSDKYKNLSLQETVETIAHSSKEIKHVIFSGGEPTLYNIALIAKQLLQTHSGWSFEVETNGTQVPHKKLNLFLDTDYQLFQWNVSPKGKNAGENWNCEALIHWVQLSHTNNLVFFKFVVRKDFTKTDVEEVDLFVRTFKPRQGSVMLMAEGTNQESQFNLTWLEGICIEKNWIFTPRLHVLLYGSRRGV